MATQRVIRARKKSDITRKKIKKVNQRNEEVLPQKQEQNANMPLKSATIMSKDGQRYYYTEEEGLYQQFY